MSPHLYDTQVIESLDGLIPEDLLDFISVAAIFEELVDLFVGEPIQKSMYHAYPGRSSHNNKECFLRTLMSKWIKSPRGL